MSSFIVLARHFFRRLFINDLVSFEEGMQQKVIAMLSILAVLYGYFAYGLIAKYQFIPDLGTSWVEKCYFLYMVMTVIGIVTVIEWDVLFPDRRDYLNLKPLPVRQRLLVFSKLASLCLFVGMFTLATAPFSAFSFIMILSLWHSSSVVYGTLFIFAHFISCLGSGLFIFFFIALLTGLLTIFLGRRIYNILSPYIRGLLLTALSVQFLMFFIQSVSVQNVLASFPALREANAARIYLFPPMWFTGLYEFILGSKDPFFRTLAAYGVMSLGILLLISLGVIYLRYTAFTRRAGESDKGHHLRHSFGFINRVFGFHLLRDPVERAVYGFFGRTLRKSQLHKTRLVFYLSLAAGLGLILLAWVSPRIHAHAVPEKALLSLPFLLSFFLLAGLRSASEMPASPRANWIFEMTEIEERRHYGLGLRKSVFFLALLPLALLVLAAFGFLWNWKESLFFSLFFLLTACLLMEGVFFNYQKIPFACNSLPGKTRLHVFWLAYFTAFIAYINLPPILALELRKRTNGYLVFYAMVLAVLAAFRILRNRTSDKKPIIYEEEPEPVLITLDMVK
jgi:hypothetical protein